MSSSLVCTIFPQYLSLAGSLLAMMNTLQALEEILETLRRLQGLPEKSASQKETVKIFGHHLVESIFWGHVNHVKLIMLPKRTWTRLSSFVWLLMYHWLFCKKKLLPKALGRAVPFFTHQIIT